ncbi:MAG: dethiobiotin synthase, partial [Gammaproteobacteria bacterium]
MTSVFVTGTDTGVGKTFISVALIELLQQQGLTVSGMKPIASGCEMTVEGLRN